MKVHQPERPVLPYRSDDAELLRFVRARARGRAAADLRGREFSPKAFEGTATTAHLLGFIESADGEPTALGRRYALADEAERAALLRGAFRAFRPYAELLGEVFDNCQTVTTLEWIQTWWATHGFGSSESNRAEAAPVFARLIAAIGAGAYVQGRKGRVSRIEWAADGGGLLGKELSGAVDKRVARGKERTSVPASPAPQAMERNRGAARRDVPARPAAPEETLEETMTGGGHRSILRWEVTSGKLVVLELPPSLSRAEKQRLLRVFELLLGE